MKRLVILMMCAVSLGAAAQTLGCMHENATNYDSTATLEDGSCLYSQETVDALVESLECPPCVNSDCPGDLTADGYIGVNDILSMLSLYDTSCATLAVPGCTDSAACNYDASATIDDGSCDFTCYGCTDPAACNYDASATEDDASCDFACYGCTNLMACNYDASATIDDGSCDFTCYGCTDPASCNYDAFVTVIIDNSCDYSCNGCMDDTACNYDDTATMDDGTNCEYPDAGYNCDGTCIDSNMNGVCDFDEEGCMDDMACNYDNMAAFDDGSCNLDGENLTLTLLTDTYPSETTWTVTDDNGNVIAQGGPYAEESTEYVEQICVDPGCYMVTLNDSAGDGMCCGYGNGGYTISSGETVLGSGGAFGTTESKEVCFPLGCTDPIYMEYDASSTTDDGSCATLVDLNCESPNMNGYDYDVVQIGGQCWFAENLRTTVYTDGTAIPEVTANAAWSYTSGLTSGARCDYLNDAGNVATYGRLYNFYAVDDARGLCPIGWHVPTHGEWQVLKSYVTSQGFSGTEGAALKSTSGWENTYGDNGTDEFGFSARPGGHRNPGNGTFGNLSIMGTWWSSSAVYVNNASIWGRYRRLEALSPDFSANYDNRNFGFSVRCLRDAE